MHYALASVFLTAVLVAPALADDKPAAQSKVTYSQVHAVFAKHCLSCHDAKEHKGKLVMESHDLILKGGKKGPAVVAGDPDKSSIYQRITTDDPDDRMPPPDKGEKLSGPEIALIRDWIKGGASAPQAGESLPTQAVVLPKVAPKVQPRNPIHALAYSPTGKLLLAARYGRIEVRSAQSRASVRTLTGHKGNVNSLTVAADGDTLVAAAGEPGSPGEVRIWSIKEGKMLRLIEGHDDAIYSVALSPDGKTLATGSYDQKIILWNMADGKPIRTLKGHNGAVFDLAFRPDGQVLASVSADRTAKLWNVATGQRLDTLTESVKDLHTVVFSPDGQRLAAGGVDNRIRVWQVSPQAKEGTNPLLITRFAHEGAILNLAWSADGKLLVSAADDRTVKLWNAPDITPRAVLDKQSDWPTALAFALDNAAAIVVGRLDGTLGYYNSADGKILPPPAPTLSALSTRGIQRGTTTDLTFTGANLFGITAVNFNHKGLWAKVAPAKEEKTESVTISLAAAADLPPGTYQVSLTTDGGTTNPLNLQVDTLAQVAEAEPNDLFTAGNTTELPASFWGVLSQPGDFDCYSFNGKAGQTFIADVASKRFDSKTNTQISLVDAAGRVLASNNEFDGDDDPFIAYTLPADGKYTVRIWDSIHTASPEHFYRITLGALPYVTAVFPLSVPAEKESKVQLVGYNLPSDAAVTLAAAQSGEAVVPLDPKTYRSRKPFKVIVGNTPEVIEAEPNDTPQQATAVPAPGVVNGRILKAQPDQPRDLDLFKFQARAGQVWVIETMAARRGSPVDTKIEVLGADGKPIPRVMLQAVKDSNISFRPIGSANIGARFPNYLELNLNDWVYINGEVVKLFFAPQGPDSEWQFYPSGGNRRNYFDTTAVSHPIDEPAYIVEPHPPGTQLPSNGLPSFTLHYVNDDDADRRLGTDSQLLFTAPADGEYLVRVTDTRDASGDRLIYRLILKQAQPDFAVSQTLNNPTLPLGAGREFDIKVDRIDGFEDPIRVDIAGVPPGFTIASPIYVEREQFVAKGVVYAAPDAKAPDEAAWANLKITATAMIGGKPVIRPVNGLGKISLGPKPAIVTTLRAESDKSDKFPPEITIAPGQMLTAILKVERTKHDGVIVYGREGLMNLPHGVIVEDLGLNGLTLLESENERRIFLHCAPDSEEKSQPTFAVPAEAGRPASAPFLIHVRKPPAAARK